MDDRELAARCRRGDRAAWDEFVARYTRFIAYAARKCLRQASDALVQDVVQNVFVELLRDERRAWARYDPRFRLTTWLGLVVHTQAERATRGRVTVPLESRVRELAADIGSAPDSETVERLRRAMPALSERERLMVVLYYLDGLSTKEITAVTGVPANTVGSHLMRAREKLKQALQ